MDKKLLHPNILKKTRELAQHDYVDRAFDLDHPEHFLAKCYACGYIGALVNAGYTITIEKDNEKYIYPKEK